jgi:hypothetical protein
MVEITPALQGSVLAGNGAEGWRSAESKSNN